MFLFFFFQLYVACAHAFYQAGCKIILCARRVDELERVKNDCCATKTVSVYVVYRVWLAMNNAAYFDFGVRA